MMEDTAPRASTKAIRIEFDREILDAMKEIPSTAASEIIGHVADGWPLLIDVIDGILHREQERSQSL